MSLSNFHLVHTSPLSRGPKKGAVLRLPVLVSQYRITFRQPAAMDCDTTAPVVGGWTAQAIFHGPSWGWPALLTGGMSGIPTNSQCVGLDWISPADTDGIAHFTRP